MAALTKDAAPDHYERFSEPLNFIAARITTRIGKNAHMDSELLLLQVEALRVM